MGQAEEVDDFGMSTNFPVRFKLEEESQSPPERERTFGNKSTVCRSCVTGRVLKKQGPCTVKRGNNSRSSRLLNGELDSEFPVFQWDHVSSLSLRLVL